MALTAKRTAELMWATWMRRALALASLAQGATSPNPLVGAVVLDVEGRLVGEGFHACAGEPHAEVGALQQAGDAARGGTLVVTLEPCCHHGRTPPCSEAVLSAGIIRVVIALEDPDPRVAGGGIAQLRAAGVEVITGVLRDLAAEQNRAFLHRVQTGRPWGVLKWAMGLDGRTALANGESQWISGPPARAWVHQLRSQVDAVIVGGGTVRADDPLLTSRGRRQPEPLRVVFSRSLALPAQAQLWDVSVAQTLVAHGPDQSLQVLPKGPERVVLSTCEPSELMQCLAQRGCNRVLWECGPDLAAAALQQGCVQEVVAVVAPKIMGGASARTPLGNLGFTAMDQVLNSEHLEVQPLGDDWLIQMRLDHSLGCGSSARRNDP